MHHLVYTICLEGSSMRTTKVFQSGRSQAILLPEDFRVESAEVYLKRPPEGFLVIPRDPWEIFFEGIEELSADFMSEGRHPPQAHKKRTSPSLPRYGGV